MVGTVAQVRWTASDLELFPEDDKRYEIIDGALFVPRAPDWKHQSFCVRIASKLEDWSMETGLGATAVAPGVIFSEADNVIPDVVWVRQERLADLLDEAGHLTAAPDLVIEVLSQGAKDQKRDRELKLKLKLYSSQGVREYWIVDRFQQQIEVYRREQAALQRVETLFVDDCLTSPLLPGFECPVGHFL